jgi:hypothetical protein
LLRHWSLARGDSALSYVFDYKYIYQPNTGLFTGAKKYPVDNYYSVIVNYISKERQSMKSRVAISAVFILIAAMVIRSQAAGLLEKLKVFETSCVNTISQVRALPILDHSHIGRNPLPAAETISPVTQTVTSNFSSTTHFLGSHVRRFERLVLNMINSDPGE